MNKTLHDIFKNLLQFQSWNDYVYQDIEGENSDASFSSDWGQYEIEKLRTRIFHPLAKDTRYIFKLSF